MIIQKHLSLREAKNEVRKLTNELELYLTKKKINFEKTQPKGTKLKEVMTSGSKVMFDAFNHYVIKDEEYDDKIYAIQESINAYERYIIEEMKRMSKYDEIGLIRYYRDEEHRTWKEIDELLHMGTDYSRTKYRRFEKKNN